METAPTPQPTTRSSIGRTLLRLTWKVLPFIIVVSICLVIILPMSSLMKAKKEALAQKQANETAAPRALTNVVTLEMIPGLLQEKLSLPGVAKPWVSLNVVAEVTGKIISKKVWEGRRVKKGDVLAVIDKSDYKNAYNSALASYETAVTNEKRIKDGSFRLVL